jgi:hypothetical protein
LALNSLARAELSRKRSSYLRVGLGAFLVWSNGKFLPRFFRLIVNKTLQSSASLQRGRKREGGLLIKKEHDVRTFLAAITILALALPPTQASTIIFNSDSDALIAQTDSKGVFKTEAATRLFDETRADIIGPVAESPAFDNSPDQTPDDLLAGQGNLLSLVVATIASCPARPSQALEICPYGIVGPRD